MEEVKTEKTLLLPSVLYKHEVSDKLLNKFVAFVGEVKKSKYIFLSRSESIVVESGVINSEQLPPDVSLIYLKIEGTHCFVEVKNRARFKDLAEVANKDLNSVVMQGPNPVAVRGLETKLRQLIDPQRFVIRTFFYRYPLTWFWTSLVIIWLGEYRLAHAINPHWNLAAPLSAGGAIVLFAVALATTLVYANVVTSIFSYWFPYFEIEGNVSIHRVRGQLLVGTVWGSLLASGIWNLFSLFKS